MKEITLNGESKDIVAENIQQLKELFPEVFGEDSIDFDKLKAMLGEYVDEDNERYNFTWWGKSRAMRLAQTPSTGTLRPCPEESKDWATTENLYIEGDNLEVLKLLQKTYHNKVKIIYIDPPYNTGKDFVYPDDYKDSLQNYLEITGQVTETGRKTSTNSESSGRYHTNWLNMMYPRLRLARNLLTNDGVIFISIDDNESSNLRKICDEIFGESSFIGELTWESTTQPDNIGKARFGLQKKVEYVLFYSKCRKGELPPFTLKTNDATKKYPHQGKFGKCRFEIIERAFDGAFARPTMRFQILEQYPREGKQWQIGEETARELEATEKVEIVDGIVKRAIYPDDEKVSYYPFWSHLSDVGTSQSGKANLTELFGASIGFDTVKPVELGLHLLQYFSNEALVLDFFGGSSSTAHAVLKANAQDGGNRNFIVVQIPELIDVHSDAYNPNYKTVCEIGKERIRRAGEQIRAELVKNHKAQQGQMLVPDEEKVMSPEDLDIGFKVFKLASSNLKKWQPNADNLNDSLFASIENFVEGHNDLDVVYEIMLKYGIDLTLPIETYNAGNRNIFSVGIGALMICLDNEITIEVAQEIVRLKAELSPEVMRVVFKDNGFKDDSAKTNTKEILRTNGVDEIVSI